MSKSLLLVAGLAASLSLAACSDKNDSKPCASGVNTNSCSAAIESKSSSVWTQTMTLGDANKPADQKKITVSYRFTNSDGQSTWERIMTITSKDSSRAMIEGGVVTESTATHLTLQKRSSSCDFDDTTEDGPITIYYLRNGSHLELDKSPIKKSKGIVDTVGSSVGRALANSISNAFKSAFANGSERLFLENINGNFENKSHLSQEEISAELGCFSRLGTGYVPSSKVKQIAP